MRHVPNWQTAALWLGAWLVTACLERPDLSQQPALEGRADGEVLRLSGGAQAPGSASSLSVLTWNVLWLGDPERGPSDEERQLAAVTATLQELATDLIALQEVSSDDSLERLLQQLPDHHAVTTQHEWPQQMALLYRRARFALRSSRQLEAIPHAGRPPLAVDLTDRHDGTELHVIVVHAKAQSGESAWYQRRALASALRAHLSARPEDERAIVAGDFNDQLGSSITAGRPSPYAELRAGLSAPTAELERGVEASSVWGSVIDHVLLSPALLDERSHFSADVLQDELLARDPAFSRQVSDHFPVVVSVP